MFKTLSPFYNIAELSNPYAVSGMLSLLAPANATLANYLKGSEADIRVDTVFDKLKKVEVS